MKSKVKILLIESSKIILTGTLVGFIIGLYQILALNISKLGISLYESRNILIIILMIVISLTLCFLSNYFIKKIPDYSGSGVPQVENYFHGHQDITWYKILPGMFMNSLFAYFTGLSLGGEGPSVTISASTGIMVNKLYKSEDIDNVRIAAGSGFGCAFLAPVSGIIYSLEKTHAKINIIFIIRASITAIIAYFISHLINHHEILAFKVSNMIDFKYYYIFAYICILNLLVSYLFKKIFILLKDLTIKKKSNFFIKNRLFFIILFTLMIGFFFTKYIGNEIFNNILSYTSIKLIIVLLIFKLLFTAISGNANISGGLLIPIFTLGALNGLLLHNLFNLDSTYLELIVFISSLSMFSYTTNSPFTAIALGISYVKIKFILLPLVIVIILGTLILKQLKSEDIYTKLVKRL